MSRFGMMDYKSLATLMTTNLEMVSNYALDSDLVELRI